MGLKIRIFRARTLGGLKKVGHIERRGFNNKRVFGGDIFGGLGRRVF